MGIYKRINNWYNYLAMTNKITNKPVVKEEVKTEVTKPKESTIDRTRSLIRDAKAVCDPVTIIQGLDNEINGYLAMKDGTEKDKRLQTLNEKYSSATYIYALDNHYAATDTVKKEYKPMVIEVTNQFIAERKRKSTCRIGGKRICKVHAVFSVFSKYRKH